MTKIVSDMYSSAENYQSLAAQVTRRIAQKIKSQSWVDWLPGERAMSESLQVSRKTIRKAMTLLQNEGLIKTVHGRGHKIEKASKVRRNSGSEITIGLLTPDSLEQQRPFTALWVDALRSLLIEKGYRLTIISGHRYFSSHPAKALARLAHQSPQSCWVLAHSNERVQQWFLDQGVPCVIAGSSHHGLNIPSVDLDYFAVCRHAVGILLRHGHRRIGFLTKVSERAGDLESEAGFSAGTRQPNYGQITPHIMRHDGTVAGIVKTLTRMLELSAAPTAILITNPAYYLTTVSFLAEHGIRVPNDVSLISRDDDTFLTYLLPVPARYSCNPRTYAKRLMQPILFQLKNEKLPHTSFRIEPKYQPGHSVKQLPGK
jgi:DNA-binding LacI/PurR family transcriptional regulator